MERPRCFSLIGPPLSGKSTIGPLLAKALNCRWADSDALVQERIGISPAEIIQSQGEEAFRAIEREAIQSALESGESLVLSCGGGAVTWPKTKELLMQSTTVILLDVPAKVLAERYLRPGAEKRPLIDKLIAEGQTPEQAIASLISSRMEIYRSCADLIISPSAYETVNDIVSNIISKF